jgi:hypothetical protein
MLTQAQKEMLEDVCGAIAVFAIPALMVLVAMVAK